MLRAVAAAIIVYALLLSFHRSGTSGKAKGLTILLAAGLGGAGLAMCVLQTLTNVASPRDWDFLCFWTYGQALASGKSPYDIALLQELALPYSPSDEFLQETYCLYPPPCVIQFWPLGHFSISVAATLWYLVQWSALVGVVVLLRRLLDRQHTAVGLLVSAALVLGLHSTISTFHYAQTNLLILLLALSSVFVSGAAYRGLLLGTATIIKPIGAIFALDLVVRRDWRSLAAMLIPAIASTSLFLGLQGWTGLAHYRDRNPLAEDIAEVFYTEEINQSLLATVLRTTGTNPGSQPILYPPFVVLAGFLTATSLVIVWRLPKGDRPLGLGCLIALALLVYPGSLAHYSVCLLLPIGLLWNQRERLPGGSQTILVGCALAYGLIWARWAFLANLSIWLLSIVCLSTLKPSAASAEPG